MHPSTVFDGLHDLVISDDEDPNVVHQVKPFTDNDITGIVDVILKDDDLNDDGLIEYVEFVTAQERQKANRDPK